MATSAKRFMWRLKREPLTVMSAVARHLLQLAMPLRNQDLALAPLAVEAVSSMHRAGA